MREIYFGEINYADVIKERALLFKESIKRNLIGGDYIKRKEFDEIINSLDRKFIIVYGNANTGKSAIIGNLCEYFDSNNITYLPLSLDVDYPNKTMIDYSQSLGLGISLVDSLFAVSKNEKAYIILDQFDAVRWNSVHSSLALTICDQLVKLSSRYRNISIIFSTRTVDLSELRNIVNKYQERDTLKEIAVSKINPTELRTILSSCNYDKLDNKTRSLLQTIGNIRMYKEIAQKKSDIVSSVELIREYFKFKYEELERLGLVESSLQIEDYIIKKQKERNQLFVSEQELLIFNQSALKKMVEIGLLDITTNKKVKYAHQSLYDYKLASELYKKHNDGQSIPKLIRAYNKNAINYIDLIKQFLELLKEDNPQSFCNIIGSILFDRKIRYLFRKLALSELMSFYDYPDQQVCLFEKIINSLLYGKQYIYQLAINKTFIVKYLIDKKVYSGNLTDFDFNQYLTILLTVIDKGDIFITEYIKLIDSNISNKDRLNRLCHSIDDVNSPDILFNKKLQIIMDNPELFRYCSIEDLDSQSPDRLYSYIKVMISINEKKGLVKFTNAQEISCTLQKYSKQINEIIYDYFLNFDKPTFGLHYFYDYNRNHIYEKLDCLKDYFKYTLKFLDAERLKYLLNSEINFVVDSVLEVIPNIAPKDGMSLTEFLITSNFISQQDFHHTRNRIYLIANCLKMFSCKLSLKRHKILENQILQYKIPNFIEFVRERLKQRLQGFYYSFWGEEQKILLSSLAYNRLLESTKNLLAVLIRKFTKPEFYPLNFREGVAECRSVVSCFDNKNFTKEQWIKILSNKKTGNNKKLLSQLDSHKNYVSSELDSIKHSVFLSANNNREMFIQIIRNNTIRKEFIPAILEGIIAENNPTTNEQNEVIVDLFKKYLNKSNEYITSLFLRFIWKNKIYNEWIIDQLVRISKQDGTNRVELLNKDIDEYEKLWEEHFSNNQTLAITCLADYVFNKGEKPIWYNELLNNCKNSKNKMLKLSELELGFACVNFDKQLAYDTCFSVVEQFPIFIRDNHVIVLLDNAINERFYKKIFDKFMKLNFYSLSKKAKEILIGRLIYYFVFYGIYKNELKSIIRQRNFVDYTLTQVFYDLLPSKSIVAKGATQQRDIKQANRLAYLIRYLIKCDKNVTENILVKVEDNISFLDEHNLLRKLLMCKNRDSFFLHNLIDVMKALTPITKYDKEIFKACTYQIKFNDGSQYYSYNVLAFLYRLYGEYGNNELKKKERCIQNIEKIYKILCNTQLLDY